ncbi:MAG: hypothetical protein H0T41_09625 [Rhodobacteraceae bacterium]|nr:hypothetical protein [Paracoccaceae bacterium]
MTNPQEQVKKFEEAVQDLIAVGELNPIEASDRFLIALDTIAKLRT